MNTYRQKVLVYSYRQTNINMDGSNKDLSPRREKIQNKLEDDAWIGRTIDSRNISLNLKVVKDHLATKRTQYDDIYMKLHEIKKENERLQEENTILQRKLEEAQLALSALTGEEEATEHTELNDSGVFWTESGLK